LRVRTGANSASGTRDRPREELSTAGETSALALSIRDTITAEHDS